MSGALAGKCALVTGSTQGIGLAAARRFAEAGCNVVLSGLAPAAEVARIRAEIEAATGARTHHCDADLARTDEVVRLLAEAEAAFGPVDILVNNAVVRHAAPVEAFSVERWEEALAVNLSAAFHAIRLTLPAMRACGWGRIINVASVYGLVGAPDRVAYVATKHALVGLTRAVALETAGQDITCNAICPGTSETPVHRAAIAAMMAADAVSEAVATERFLAPKQPTGRFVASEAVAGLMLFLCGPDGRDVTGAALPIDGAWTAR